LCWMDERYACMYRIPLYAIMIEAQKMKENWMNPRGRCNIGIGYHGLFI
jgi:hypothetical protein